MEGYKMTFLKTLTNFQNVCNFLSYQENVRYSGKKCACHLLNPCSVWCVPAVRRLSLQILHPHRCCCLPIVEMKEKGPETGYVFAPTWILKKSQTKMSQTNSPF